MRKLTILGLILLVQTGVMAQGLSDHTSVGPGSELPAFLAFPNPSDGILRLECQARGKVKIQLLDLNGKVLLGLEYRGHAEIDTGHLAAGTYLLVQRWEDHIERHKLIIY